MSNFKRMIALVLSIVIVASMLPCSVYGDESNNSFEPITWQVRATIAGATIEKTVSKQSDDYTTADYTKVVSWDVILDNVSDNATITMEVKPLGSTQENATYGTFPKVSTIGYKFSDMIFGDNGACITDELIERICQDHTERNYTFNVTLADGKARLVVFYYEGGSSNVQWQNLNQGSKTPTVFVFDLVTKNRETSDSIIQKVTPRKGQLDLENEFYALPNEGFWIVPYGTETAELELVLSRTDVEIKVNDGEYAPVSETTQIVSLNAAPKTSEGVDDRAVNHIEFRKTGTDEIIKDYKLTVVSQRFSDLPTAVVDYLCIGSQYTNVMGRDDYGLRPVRSLVGSNYSVSFRENASGPVSLGNFGGYIIYYYENAITDNPANPYGIDFITYGNSFVATNDFNEPGQVWVSENGGEWYALAGAMHYEDFADWEYWVKYTRLDDGSTKAENSHGTSENLEYTYPNSDQYPIHSFSDDDLSSITLTGIHFDASKSSNQYGNILPRFAGFGYTDQGSLGTRLPGENADAWSEAESFALLARNNANNPYLKEYENVSYSRPTDGMDLAWAVDSNGQPVSLENGIHYIKIVTASNINNSAINEKSTEVNMVRVAAPAASEVGLSEPPASIVIDGNSIDLSSFSLKEGDNHYVYNSVEVDGPFRVTVETDNSNVYINSSPGSDALFNAIPSHNILRVIVQDGEKEPLIYLFNLVGKTSNNESYDTLILDPTSNGTVNDNGQGNTYTYLFDSHMSGMDLPTPVHKKPTTNFFDGWYFNGQLMTSFPEVVGGETYTFTASWLTKNEYLAKQVDILIEAIGEVTLDSGPAIAEARNAYDSLSSGAKKKVKNLAVLEAAEATYASLVNQNAADLVSAAIEAIGEVTISSEPAIQAAREAYNALNDEQKALVENLATLEAAENTFDALKTDWTAAQAVDNLIEAIGSADSITLESGAAIKAARNAYDSLTDAQKTYVEKLSVLSAAEAKYAELEEAAEQAERDTAVAKGVDQQIEAIGNVTLESESVINAARAAFEALTEAQKAYVEKLDVLEAAEVKYAELKAAEEQAEEDAVAANAVISQITSIGEVTRFKEEAIQKARIAYEALTEDQKALVTNLDVLEAAEARLEELQNGVASDDETITVSFRLIGSTLASEDKSVSVDLGKGEDGYYNAEYQNWIKTKTYTMHSDDSVYDLFVKATGDAGIESRGASSGYVSAIKAPDALGGYWLSEMDNGKYSGWMYTMDGKHTNAIKDQLLVDGAKVVFHYVNDYRYEVEDWFDEPSYPSLATDDTFFNRWLEAPDVNPSSQGGGGTTPAEETEVVDPVDTPEDPNGGATVGRFIDVDEDDWFAEAVGYAVENGFMVGTGEDTFSPQKTLTRGMLASMLYSMEGAPAEDGQTSFTDVDPSDWFAKGVEWAVENGVAAGYGERFGPNDDITREQMVVMLYGYAKMKGYELVEGEDLSGYEDAGEISSWALPAMQWAKAAGLVSGRSATKMAPQGTTTRAEAATIMRNFLENVAK